MRVQKINLNTFVDHARKTMHGARAFSLIELLVVLGIMAVLLSIIMPTLSKARRQAMAVQCQSNLRQLGQCLAIYANDNGGWLFPVGSEEDGRPTTLGSQYPPHLRWPMYVPAFQLKLPDPLPYEPATYKSSAYDPEHFSAAPFTPPILRCPVDDDPYEAHSYVLNQHLADERIRAATVHFAGLTSSQVIIAGEKFNTQRDYYMERSDYEKVVDTYHHGINFGSNYLFHDGHVDTRLPPRGLTGLDPWAPRLPE